MIDPAEFHNAIVSLASVYGRLLAEQQAQSKLKDARIAQLSERVVELSRSAEANVLLVRSHTLLRDLRGAIGKLALPGDELAQLVTVLDEHFAAADADPVLKRIAK